MLTFSMFNKVPRSAQLFGAMYNFSSKLNFNNKTAQCSVFQTEQFIYNPSSQKIFMKVTKMVKVKFQ